MKFSIRGIHHVTATVNEAQEDLDFYSRLLGLRVVKKTVNLDNTGVYHFYYGNERGEPGTIMTTFPYKGKGVRQGVKGHGQVVDTTFSIPKVSQISWKHRLTKAGINLEEFERFGAAGLRFADPSGLRIELVEADDNRNPWVEAGVGEDMAIRGIHSVTMVQQKPDATVKLMTENLNFVITREEGNRMRLEAEQEGSGKIVDILIDPYAEKGKNGIGTVHHVALAVSSDEEQGQLHRFLREQGHKVTDILDRNYFHSIYFREPGGVLFEVATIPPGFMVDESKENLGKDLKLPTWEEENRSKISAELPEVDY